MIYNETVFQITMPFTIAAASQEPEPAIAEELKNTAKRISDKLALIEDKFSAFKDDSLLAAYNRGQKEILLTDPDFQAVYAATSLAYEMTDGAFDPVEKGVYDPTGYVKGWAIKECFNELTAFKANPNVLGLCINGAGDLQTWSSGSFAWQVGIEDPDNLQKFLAKYEVKNGALATSGFSKRGKHIRLKGPGDLLQVSVLAKDVAYADIWATAGLACGQDRFLQMAKKEKLSATVINQDRELLIIQEGEIYDVQKA
ncbi:FAD:protein FMN transferase [Lactobacillus sp.]|uniref:FAD:protein FMN transferase n=1 Tax=Lactobacillus sp. TaxID=1591 RepID=UPI003EFA1022